MIKVVETMIYTKIMLLMMEDQEKISRVHSNTITDIASVIVSSSTH